jgi:SAM-dependent methyltransferase
MSEPSPSPGRTSLACAGAIFLGAFLLFQVQPIVAKAILPRYGGAPAVWTTCMLFFQTLLLGGYAYAHATATALKPRAQGILHTVLLAAALCTLPIYPKPGELAGVAEAPMLEILGLLLRSVAAPYFLLASTSPLLQSWSAAGGGGSPYRLYALSNVGSMLALLSYPVAVEPWLTTRQQETIWSVAFGAFAVLSALSVRLAWKAAPTAAKPAEEPPVAPPTLGRRLMWLALPACASTLLLAVTNQMCQEVAVVPFLWLIPLSLYLLSFILPFESDRWYSRSWCIPVLALVLIVLTSAAAMGARAGILYGVPVYSAGLFICCLFCHGELAARRPATRHLTSYYLLMSLGGALGGVFVSLIAPLLFRGFDEIYVGLAACGALAAGIAILDPANIIAGRRMFNPMQMWLVGVVAVVVIVLGMRLAQRARPELRELRDFYGTIRVAELPSPDGRGTIRFLTHVGTRHGQQYTDPERRTMPTSYFTHRCGIGILLDELADAPPRRMGIIGLGAGILATYGRPGDLIRYYELSPRMIDVARSDFTFLSDSKAKTEVVPGDARLSLEREMDEPPYDILVGDAFSSDAIPAHLLTREAFQIYAKRLKPGGVLALNVSTRHLDLGPLIKGLAETIGRSAVQIVTETDDEGAALYARWILITSDPSLFERPKIKAVAKDPSGGQPSPRLWTDDYSNLLQVLKR